MSNPQITAKLKLDARDVKSGSIEAQKELASMGSRMRSSIGGSLRGVLRGSIAPIGAALTASVGVALTKGLRGGLQQALAMENAETLMQSTLGSLDKAKEAMALIREEAEKNPMFSKKEMAEAAKALSVYADGSTEKLKGMLKTAERLSILNPEQGIGGAAYALREMISGDPVSLSERFNISKAAIREGRAAGLEGKELVDTLLERMGVNDQTLADQANTREAQLSAINNQLSNIGEMFFDALWPELGPYLKDMQSWMKTNGQEVVDGLKIVADAASAIAKVVVGTFGVFDKVTELAADATMGWQSPIFRAVQGTSAMGHALREFSSANMSGEAAAAYVSDTIMGARLGSRSRQALATGQVQPAAAQSSMTINVTGNGVTPQMSNS